jgi:hypothetical protein
VFQLLVLCRVFEEDQNPSLSTRALLADKLENSALRHAVFVSFGDDDTVVDSLL